MITSYPEGTTHYIKMDFTCAYFKKGEGGALYIYEDVSGEWGAVKDSARGFVETHAKPVGAPRGGYTPPSWVAAAQVHGTVQSPKHYQLLPGVEVYDIRQALAAKATAAGATLDQFSDYDRAVEYLLRMWEKNGVEDAQKAQWYINKLVEKLNGSGS